MLGCGAELEKRGCLEEALECYEWAISTKTDFALAYVKTGDVLQRLCRFDQALSSYDRAILLKEDCTEALFERAALLQYLKKYDQAMDSYDRAIEINPDFATAYWGKSNLKLLLGDYEQGWQLHEWRWKIEAYRKIYGSYSAPLWLGEQPLAGKTLLIHAEAGLGDTIQYSRYVPMAEALGAQVIFEVPAPLVPLMSTLGINVKVIEQGTSLPDFDVHCPAMSLPLAFRTTLTTVPATVPYLSVDPQKTELCKQRLGNKTKPRIGIIYTGMNGRDLESNPATKRTIPLELLYPLFQLPLEFHLMQKDIRPDDTAALANIDQLQVHNKYLKDFSDTAALAQEMDLVISIDTSVAHLVAALGQPVWVLLPFSTDYRWTREGVRTPWYPSALLFRQSAIGDWSAVISDVVHQLQRLIF